MTVRRPGRWVAASAAVLLAVSLAAGVEAAASAAPASTVGATGGGDPYFPMQGNGGYDVGHYDLAVGYTPGTKQLTGVAKISATTTPGPLAVRPRPAPEPRRVPGPGQRPRGPPSRSRRACSRSW